jgi:hypothetical protein
MPFMALHVGKEFIIALGVYFFDAFAGKKVRKMRLSFAIFVCIQLFEIPGRIFVKCDNGRLRLKFADTCLEE